MSNPLPRTVLLLSHHHDAWIVGSAANPTVEKPKDYDVLVPFRNWQAASAMIPSFAVPNRFGGWNFDADGATMDVWPGDLSWVMQYHKCEWAW